MITFAAIIKLIFLMIVIPFILGFFLDNFFSKSESGEISEKFMLSRCFVLGFCFELALFQLIAVPFIIKRAAFHDLRNLYLIVLLVITVFSLLASLKNIKRRFLNKFNEIKNMKFNIPLWIIVIVMIVFQTQLLFTHMHMDTDDSRFIAEALEACEKDTMLQLNCITGEHLDTFVGELRKEVAAPYPFFIAAVASLTKIHPAILAHMCFPVFLIPLFYMCMYMIGRFFFSDSHNKVPLYMLILSVVVLFSFESRFSWGYTLLTIIWQGRSIACVILLPAYFYVLSNIYTENNVSLGIGLSLFVTSLAAANTSGMASMMAATVSGVFAILILFSNLFIKNNKDNLVLRIKKVFMVLVCSSPVFIYFSLLFLLGM